MFTKINPHDQKIGMGASKKVLIISIIVLILVLGFGFLFYKSIFNKVYKTEIPTQQNTIINDKPQQKPEVQFQTQSIKAQGTNGGGTLTVCLDKCGDGICQKTDPNCKSGDLNCICLETPKECPQDCR